MITPRATRLVRVSDLHEFRRTITHLCLTSAASPADRAVIVPGRAAAIELRRTLRSAAGENGPLLLTRDQLYEDLGRRLDDPPRLLTLVERDAIMQAAAADAAKEAEGLPFRIRPGLVAEMLRFYDQLRRQSQQVARFEALIVQALGSDTGADAGIARLLQQTRFLAGAFLQYERRTAETGAVDEHGLRARLIGEPAPHPLGHAIVTVPDWIADPDGLFVADFDLFSRIPALQSLDIVATASLLGSGFHERLRDWLPGLEEIEASVMLEPVERVRPLLVRPETEAADDLWFTYRDREEELLAVARRMIEDEPDARRSSAIVFKRPLPYLYLAPQTLGAAGIPFEVADALPLAAEPIVATVDLLLDLLESRFAREPLVAILRSPHVTVVDDEGRTIERQAVAALNETLSDARYLGGRERLEALRASADAETMPALQGAVRMAGELEEVLAGGPASVQVRRIIDFLDRHWKYQAPVRLEADTTITTTTDDEVLSKAEAASATISVTIREAQARAAMMQVLADLADAHARHHDPHWTLDDLATAVRRWIGAETFFVPASNGGIRLLDDQAARYSELDEMTIVGLVEHEWPERSRRNIFYPPALLKALGWPSEKDRRAASDARFVDLLASASTRVELSVFTLDDDAIVTRSVQLDEVPSARLSTITRKTLDAAWSPDEALAQVDPQPRRQTIVGEPLAWLGLRTIRSAADRPQFHGAAGQREAIAWSVSALETYLSCPFKFFAQHVLRLEEEPDDEEVMDPRRQGQFVHEVFEAFFKAWQAAGHCGITVGDLAAARALFTEVVDRALERLPEGEAALERTRLLGSPAAAGLGEAVFRMEAERETPVVERLLEHSLKGRFAIATASGTRDVDLRGKADRLDLLADGTFRVIDYKLGWPPDRGRALQLPIYGLCAERRLDGHRGRRWALGEAVYLAFKGPKRVVPLFTSASRDEVLAKAQQRLSDTLDAIERGDFPPSPDDVFRCETCSFTSVCRKDYVGDV